MAALFIFLIAGAAWAQPAPDLVRRGAYVFAAAGCISCHTDFKNKGKPLAGGRALKTPFGTFYGPNITPDPVYGIGRWSDADFIRALREGVSPSGDDYFPVFPYTAFSQMTDGDMVAMKAYIFSLPAVARPNRAHDVPAPFRWRFLQRFWKWLYFAPGPYRPDPVRGAEWNRGAYLVRALVHCGQCHTPRNALGALDRDRWLAGADDGPDGEGTPNITPHRESGLRDLTSGGISGRQSTRQACVTSVCPIMACVMRQLTSLQNWAAASRKSLRLPAISPLQCWLNIRRELTSVGLVAQP